MGGKRIDGNEKRFTQSAEQAGMSSSGTRPASVNEFTRDTLN
jgi:hypothetical protein